VPPAQVILACMALGADAERDLHVHKWSCECRGAGCASTQCSRGAPAPASWAHRRVAARGTAASHAASGGARLMRARGRRAAHRVVAGVRVGLRRAPDHELLAPPGELRGEEAREVALQEAEDEHVADRRQRRDQDDRERHEREQVARGAPYRRHLPRRAPALGCGGGAAAGGCEGRRARALVSRHGAPLGSGQGGRTNRPLCMLDSMFSALRCGTRGLKHHQQQALAPAGARGAGRASRGLSDAPAAAR